jgi:hypothetical protein
MDNVDKEERNDRTGEMLILILDKVTFIDSKGYRLQDIDKYLREKGANRTLDYTESAISYILADGWEPYTVSGSHYYFRRKYQG